MQSRVIVFLYKMMHNMARANMQHMNHVACPIVMACDGYENIKSIYTCPHTWWSVAGPWYIWLHTLREQAPIINRLMQDSCSWQVSFNHPYTKVSGLQRQPWDANLICFYQKRISSSCIANFEGFVFQIFFIINEYFWYVVDSLMIVSFLVCNISMRHILHFHSCIYNLFFLTNFLGALHLNLKDWNHRKQLLCPIW